MTLTVFLGVFLTTLQILPGTTPRDHGRTGNYHLKQEQLREAASAYQEGLSSIESPSETDQTYYGLQNNLGLTLHGQENYEEAFNAFDQALSFAPNNHDAAVAAFNAGNNAFSTQQLERALEYYQTALMADPTNEDAKYNFEYVTRQLQQQQQQEQDQSDEGEDQQQEQEDQQDGDQNDQQEQEQNENERQQQQQEEQNSEQNETQPSEEQPSPEESPEPSDQTETPLTREQAEQILEALENEEEQLLREVQKIEGRPRRVAKDW